MPALPQARPARLPIPHSRPHQNTDPRQTELYTTVGEARGRKLARRQAWPRANSPSPLHTHPAGTRGSQQTKHRRVGARDPRVAPNSPFPSVWRQLHSGSRARRREATKSRGVAVKRCPKNLSSTTLRARWSRAGEPEQVDSPITILRSCSELRFAGVYPVFAPGKVWPQGRLRRRR